jgi:hypothetical protein
MRLQSNNVKYLFVKLHQSGVRPLCRMNFFSRNVHKTSPEIFAETRQQSFLSVFSQEKIPRPNTTYLHSIRRPVHKKQQKTSLIPAQQPN